MRRLLGMCRRRPRFLMPPAYGTRAALSVGAMARRCGRANSTEGFGWRAARLVGRPAFGVARVRSACETGPSRTLALWHIFILKMNINMHVTVRVYIVIRGKSRFIEVNAGDFDAALTSQASCGACVSLEASSMAGAGLLESVEPERFRLRRRAYLIRLTHDAIEVPRVHAHSNANVSGRSARRCLGPCLRDPAPDGLRAFAARGLAPVELRACAVRGPMPVSAHALAPKGLPSDGQSPAACG